METMICENIHTPERRRAPRIPYRTAANYNGASFRGAGTIKDVSSEGLFLETAIPLNVRDEIRIEFQLRNSKHPMHITGEIARISPAGAGVQFLWN